MSQQYSQDPREAAKPVFDAAMGKIIQAFNLTNNRELGWTFDAQHKSRVMDCMTELIALFEGGDIAVNRPAVALKDARQDLDFQMFMKSL